MTEFFVLGFFFFVVVIPVIAGVGGDLYRRKLKLQEKQLELQSTMTAEKAAQYAAHTERLEQRMRVLERIITDKGVDLADQIEDLRDRPLN
jgi:ABC-type phosphate transport system auxiliary subunit